MPLASILAQDGSLLANNGSNGISILGTDGALLPNNGSNGIEIRNVKGELAAYSESSTHYSVLNTSGSLARYDESSNHYSVLALDGSYANGTGMGPNILTNGTFDSSTGWTTQNGSTAATVTAGEAVIAAGQYLQQMGLSIPANASYQVTVRLRTTNTCQFKFSLVTGNFLAGEQVILTGVSFVNAPAQNYTFTATNNATPKTGIVIREQVGGSGTMYIDSISMNLL